MKIGMISFAHMHAHAYAKYVDDHPEATLVAIWDEESDRGQMMAKKYGCEYFSNLEVFLETDIDAVIVCSENAKHKEHVMASARAKKHILCEKPIATEVEDAVEMIRACQEEGVTLQIAFPVRMTPIMNRVKSLVRSGAIGEVVAINGTNHGQMPGGWFIQKELSGGGAAVDHIVHVADVIRWMLDDEVKSVYAEFDTRFYDIDVEDCGMVMLELESGIIATIDPSWSRPKSFPTWGDVTMEIIGTKGSLSVDAFKQHTLYYNNEAGKLQHLPWDDDMDAKLVDSFIHSIKEGEPPAITGEDGLRTLEIVKAAYSANEKKQTVSLSRVLV